MPGLTDWLGAPMFGQQQGGLPPQLMAQAGIPQTNRLAAIGQMLMGLGQGANQRSQQGGGLFSQLAGGAAGGAGALVGAREQERQQTLESLLQQAQIAKMMRPEGSNAFLDTLQSSGLPPEEQKRLKNQWLESQSSENRPPTWSPPNEQQRANFPGAVAVSDRGEPRYPSSEAVVSPVEARRLQISEMLAAGTIGNAQATRELAAANALATNNERAIAGDRNLREDRDALRAETMKSPAISQARQAAPFLQSIEAAAKTPGTMSDLDLTYAIAKIFDPTSVVRETEQGMVLQGASGSALIPTEIMKAFNIASSGQGISPEQRKQVVNQARTRVKSYVEASKPDVDYYTGLAKKRGYDPSDILPNMPSVSDEPIDFSPPPPPPAPPIVQPSGTGVNVGPGIPPLPPGFVPVQ